MRQYEFLIPNSKSKFYNRFAIFLFLLNDIAVAGFLNIGIVSNTRISFGLAVIVINLVSTGIFFFGKGHYKKDLFIISLLVIAAFWSLTIYWWLGILMFVLLVLYYISQRHLIVQVQENMIIYPSFPQQVIRWNELNNVVLKDGLLTIDQKNNKIIQHEVNENDEVDEQEFNEFCRARFRDHSE
jgi:hypothetical protein